MVRLNVQDYGAVADGATNDAPAIQAALDDADRGDTVYFPEGTYLVAAGDKTAVSANPIEIHGDRHPDDLTLVGEGHASHIRLADGHTNPDHHHFLVRLFTGAGIEGLLVRDLRFDANKDGQPGARGGFALAFGNDTGNPLDVTVRRCWAEDASQSNIGLTAGVTVEDCTVTGAVKHNIVMPPADGQAAVRGCYVAGAENRYGIDSSGGPLTVEDTVIENNAYGTKTSHDSSETIYRRVRVAGNELFGYQETGQQDPVRVVMDDVVFEDNGDHGARLGGNHVYEVGRLLSTGNAGNGVDIIEDASVDATEVRSCANDGVGLSYWTSAVDVHIETYIHSLNADGATSSDVPSIGEQVEGNCGGLDTVPTAEEAGADGTSPRGGGGSGLDRRTAAAVGMGVVAAAAYVRSRE